MECSALTQEVVKEVFNEAMRLVLKKRLKQMARKESNKRNGGGCSLI